VEAFLKTDEQFSVKAESEELFSGTTAITAFIRGDKLVVANCGDSRAVMCRKGGVFALSR
jgi:serine/threonine protein phosphatase PrpC